MSSTKQQGSVPRPASLPTPGGPQNLSDADPQAECKSPTRLIFRQQELTTWCLERDSLTEKKKEKEIGWGARPWEGREESLPLPLQGLHLASTLKGLLLPLTAGVFHPHPSPGPWPQTCFQWCLFWKDLCRCYFDKTLIPFLPLPRLNLSTSTPKPLCLCAGEE